MGFEEARTGIYGEELDALCHQGAEQGGQVENTGRGLSTSGIADKRSLALSVMGKYVQKASWAEES